MWSRTPTCASSVAQRRAEDTRTTRSRRPPRAAVPRRTHAQKTCRGARPAAAQGMTTPSKTALSRGRARARTFVHIISSGPWSQLFVDESERGAVLPATEPHRRSSPQLPAPWTASASAWQKRCSDARRLGVHQRRPDNDAVGDPATSRLLGRSHAESHRDRQAGARLHARHEAARSPATGALAGDTHGRHAVDEAGRMRTPRARSGRRWRWGGRKTVSSPAGVAGRATLRPCGREVGHDEPRDAGRGLGAPPGQPEPQHRVEVRHERHGGSAVHRRRTRRPAPASRADRSLPRGPRWRRPACAITARRPAGRCRAHRARSRPAPATAGQAGRERGVAVRVAGHHVGDERRPAVAGPARQPPCPCPRRPVVTHRGQPPARCRRPCRRGPRP